MALFPVRESSRGKSAPDVTAPWRVGAWGEKGAIVSTRAQISCRGRGPRAVQPARSVQILKLLPFLLKKMDLDWGEACTCHCHTPSPRLCRS